MSYALQVITPLIFVGVAMMVAGIAGCVGTGALSLSNLDNEFAVALALLMVFCLAIMASSTTDDMAAWLDALAGGIPIVDEISDYGSYRAVLSCDPHGAAVAFLDTFVMCVIMNLAKFIPSMVTGGTTGHGVLGRLFVKIFQGMVCGFVALVVLNYVVKQTGAYQAFVSVLGGIIATLAALSIPAVIGAVLSSRSGRTVSTVGAVALLGAYLSFSRSYPMAVLRSALFQALAFFVSLYVLETFYGSLTGAVAATSNFLVVFGPVFVMLLGIYFIVSAICKR
jgi:hypothetical protein